MFNKQSQHSRAAKAGVKQSESSRDRDMTLLFYISRLQGQLFALHTVACIFAWNARRPRRGGCGGCLDQEGMREDLVGMFRRALEGGLQTVSKDVNMEASPTETIALCCAVSCRDWTFVFDCCSC